jgi:hypothetical protein
MMSYQILRGKRFWGLGVFFALILWGSYWAYQHKALGFSVAKITSTFSNDGSLGIEEPSGRDLDQLRTALRQKYKFLAVGSQSYAFVSEDGKYVIKFFRMKHLIPRISDAWNKGRIEYQRENLLSIFKAHKMAYDEYRKDAGLVYIHLNRSGHLETKLTVSDVLGRSHVIDLDQTEFVLQEKAELIFTRLKKLVKQRDKSGVQSAIAAVMDLVKRRIDQGIADHDKAVKHNYGFVGDRPVQLDIGRIYKASKPHDYQRIEKRINEWLQANASDI